MKRVVLAIMVLSNINQELLSRFGALFERHPMSDFDKPNAAVSAKLSGVKEVLFDFEGTLVDFQWQLASAVAETLDVLSEAGLQRRWYGEKPGYAHIYNHTLDLVAQGKGSSGSAAAALVDVIYDRYDADALTRWALYPDTLETLVTLKNQGYKIALVSNVGKKSLQRAMEKLQLSSLIQVVISRDDVSRIKPHPEGLLSAAKALGVPPMNVLVVGDSRNDVLAARNAGMLAGYLRGGEDSPEAMALFPADVELDRLTQLPPMLSCS